MEVTGAMGEGLDTQSHSLRCDRTQTPTVTGFMPGKPNSGTDVGGSWLLQFHPQAGC
jgi:hypothetical protein